MLYLSGIAKSLRYFREVEICEEWRSWHFLGNKKKKVCITNGTYLAWECCSFFAHVRFTFMTKFSHEKYDILVSRIERWEVDKFIVRILFSKSS